MPGLPESEPRDLFIIVTAQLNLNMSWELHDTRQTLSCYCAAGRVTIGDNTSLLTSYRSAVVVLKNKTIF